jgi:hypothetical protein
MRAISLVLLWASAVSAQTFDAASVKGSSSNNPNGSTFEYLYGGGLRVGNGDPIVAFLVDSAVRWHERQV